jgi:NADH:ubiquinone oxidoreductase subunit D
MKIRLGMTGDHIASVETHFGYASRGIENRVRGQRFDSAQFQIGRIEPESALILDRLFSECIEKIYGIEISARVIWIRKICAELSELNFQLKFLAKMASRMGLKILYHTILKQRETLLDLFELLSGSRYGYSYLKPGGARYDLTDGFQERLDAWIRGFLNDHGRIQELFCWTHPIQNRLKSMGMILDLGEYGYVSEAAVENTRFGHVSHVESRLLYSLQSCKEISEDLKGLLESSPAGPFILAVPSYGVQGEAKSEIETLRGMCGLRIEVDAERRIQSLEVQTPSDLIRKAIVPALEGESIEDLPLILESLSLSVSEIDR